MGPVPVLLLLLERNQPGASITQPGAASHTCLHGASAASTGLCQELPNPQQIPHGRASRHTQQQDPPAKMTVYRNPTS